MPNLREYFYPYIDNPGCKIIYEYYRANPSQTPYCQTIVYPGIAILDYPMVQGSTYFTRKDAYWKNGGYTDKINLWYMRHRGYHIVEEIVDENPIGATPIYYFNNNITHAYSDNGQEFESRPICSVYRTGSQQFAPVCDHRWWSSCCYKGYYTSWTCPVTGRVWPNVIKMTFIHGGYDRRVLPKIPCSSPHPNPPGYNQKIPYTSYWEEKWYAKGTGKVYGSIIFYEQSCDGAYYSGNVWDHYLKTHYGG